MPKLILIRHGQSQWNLENRFTGWVDIDLSDEGREEARRAGEHLKGMKIDVVYTSVLKRAINTAAIALETAGMSDLPVTRAWQLNERHYGDLQGLNKDEMREKFGKEQVHIWRRSYDTPPPGKDAESLKMTIERVMPYFREHIVKDLANGKNVLVVAHGNSLRALLFVLDNHTPETIPNVNIPTGIPIVYDLDVESDGTLKVKEKEELV